MTRGYTGGPYGQIHYRIVQPASSRKTPLLCLHPSPISGIVYDHWLVEMGQDRLAVAPDTPGYGGSDTPPAPVQIGDFADAMIAFMDHMQMPVVDLMGYHTGSLTSVELARRHPGRVRKIVMISAPNWTPAELQSLETIMGIGQKPPTYETALEKALVGWRTTGKGLFRDMPDEQYFDLCIERLRHYRTSTWGFAAAFKYDVCQALTTVNQPVLLLNPEDDVYDATLRAEPFLKNGKMHNLPGWTHGHLDIHTVEMANIVRGFLDGDPV
jgi:pimeloyl-ACP methyl ester carboxylesterase